jgi:hypothetical protein
MRWIPCWQSPGRGGGCLCGLTHRRQVGSEVRRSPPGMVPRWFRAGSACGSYTVISHGGGPVDPTATERRPVSFTAVELA